LCNKI
jgi:hypothetical protein